MPWLLAQEGPAAGQNPPAGPNPPAAPAETSRPAESAPGAQPESGAPAVQPQTGAPAGPPPGLCGGGPELPFLLIGIWGIFYLLVFRPQRKQEKERKARLEALKKGDVIRTRGGVVAPVVRVKDDTVVLQLEGDARVELVVAKAYVDEVYGKDEDGKKSAK